MAEGAGSAHSWEEKEVAVAPPPEIPPDDKVVEEGEEPSYDNLAPATARERRAAHEQRQRRLSKRDSSDQVGNAGEDWRLFDVPKAMSSLHSEDEAVRRKALMRLHVRWFHATAQQLSTTLRAAGAKSHWGGASSYCPVPNMPRLANS